MSVSLKESHTCAGPLSGDLKLSNKENYYALLVPVCFHALHTNNDL